MFFTVLDILLSFSSKLHIFEAYLQWWAQLFWKGPLYVVKWYVLKRPCRSYNLFLPAMTVFQWVILWLCSQRASGIQLDNNFWKLSFFQVDFTCHISDAPKIIVTQYHIWKHSLVMNNSQEGWDVSDLLGSIRPFWKLLFH